MKKFINLTTFMVILCMLATMACGCSEKKDEETATESSVVEATTVETTAAMAKPIIGSTDDTSATTAGDTTTTTAAETTATTTAAEAEKSDLITDEMALDAIHNRCVLENPENVDLGADHWLVVSSTDSQIVVLFNAYTGAEIRYYIDRATGDTHVTELVPGIFDEEQDSDESFNAREYITAEIYR